MTRQFDPKQDFLLPSGVFAERLLNGGASPAPKENAFDMLLPKALADACMQVQAGLQLMAINNEWPGYEKILPARISDNDPSDLSMVQSVLNGVHESYLSPVINDEEPSLKAYYALPYSRLVGLKAIMNADVALADAGQHAAVDRVFDFANSEKDTVEMNHISYEQSVRNYFNTLGSEGIKNANKPKV